MQKKLPDPEELFNLLELSLIPLLLGAPLTRSVKPLLSMLLRCLLLITFDVTMTFLQY
jgi:hypothetical protein